MNKLSQTIERVSAGGGFLGALVDFAKLHHEAKAMANNLTGRFDIPEDATPDLLDTQTRLFLTKDGQPLAGRILPSDLVEGSDSAATPLLIACLPILAALVYAVPTILGSLSPTLGVWAAIGMVLLALPAVFAIMWTLNQAEGKGKAAFYVLVGFVMPMLAPLLIQPIGSILGNMVGSSVASGLMSQTAGVSWVAKLITAITSAVSVSIVLAGLGMGLATFLMLFGHREKLRSVLRGYLQIAVVAVIGVFLTVLLGAWAGMLPFFFIAAYMPMNFARANALERVDLLLLQQRMAIDETTNRAQLLTHVEARKAQAERALKDTSPTFEVGKALGVQALKFDGFGPDAGKKVVVSYNDLMTHMIVFGKTGTGKTAAFARPFAVDIRRTNLATLKANPLARELARSEYRHNPFDLRQLVATHRAAGQVTYVVVANLKQRADFTLLDVDFAMDFQQAKANAATFEEGDLVLIDRRLKPSEAYDAWAAPLLAKGVQLVRVGEPVNPLFGLFIADGKGALGGELRGLSDLTIEPGVALGLLQDLADEDVMIALSSVSNAGKAGQGDGNAAFWVSSGLELARHTWVLTRALVEQEHRQVAAYAEQGFTATRSWFRTLGSWKRMRDQMAALQFDKATQSLDLNSTMKDILHYLEHGHLPTDGSEGAVAVSVGPHPEAHEAGSLLRQAIDYARLWPSKDDKERSGFLSTVESWMSPFFADSRLTPWTVMEEGVDPTICLRGGIVGMNISPAEYGIAGLMVTAFVRQRIVSTVRRRGGYDWRNLTGESQVFMLMDEAQELLTEKDVSMAAVARSLGLTYKALTQDVEGIVGRMGNEKLAQNLLNQFRSWVCIGVPSHATQQWMKESVGTGWVRTFKRPQGGIDFKGTIDMVRSQAALDEQSPDAAAFRLRRIEGALALTHEWSAGDEITASGRSVVTRGINQQHLRVQMGGMLENKALLQESDFQDYGNKPWAAFVNLNRAGFPRRDWVTIEPLFDIPADVVDEEVQP